MPMTDVNIFKMGWEGVFGDYKQRLITLSHGIGNEKKHNQYSKVFKIQFKMGLPDSYHIAMSDLNEDADSYKSEIPNYQDYIVSYMDDLFIHSKTVE